MNLVTVLLFISSIAGAIGLLVARKIIKELDERLTAEIKNNVKLKQVIETLGRD